MSLINELHFSFSGGSITTQFDFNSFADEDDIYTVTSSLQQGTDDNTLNLAVALDYVRRNIFSPDAGSRSGVPKILVVVADNLKTAQVNICTAIDITRDVYVGVCF